MSKKLICLLLAVAICAVTFVGCATKNEPVSKDIESKGTDESKKTEDTVKIATPSWKTDTSDNTITWFISYDWYGKKFDPENNLFDKWLYEETGNKIDIQTGDFDKFNVLIKTNALPDVITTDANSTQRKLLENNGKLLPLNELKDKYAPDLHVPQSQIDWYTAPDKNWYSLCSFYYGDDNVKDNNGFFETHNANFVRNDIMEQIGCKYEDLRTKEGFLNALRKVKGKNIKYNGVSVIPYMALFNDQAAQYMAYQFGASEETPAGQYQSVYRTPEFLEAMLFYNQMYTEGLMTDESFTVNKDQIEQKDAAGQIFATSIWNTVSISRNSLFAADNKATILYCGTIKGDNHDKVAVPAKSNAGWTATMINKTAKKPDRIIQLFSFLSQKETVLNSEWGVDGYKIEDGHVVRDPKRVAEQNENPTAYSAKYAADFPFMMDYTFIQGTYPKDDSVFGKDVENRTRDKNIIIYDDKCFTDTIPEAGTEEAAILARINEYVSQALGRMITAPNAEKCKQLYNEAIAEMDKLGLKKLEEYQNTRFQENKKKLGIEFAHPFNVK